MQRMFTDGINGIIRSFNSLAEVIGVSIDEIDFTPMTLDAPKHFKSDGPRERLRCENRLVASAVMFWICRRALPPRRTK